MVLEGNVSASLLRIAQVRLLDLLLLNLLFHVPIAMASNCQSWLPRPVSSSCFLIVSSIAHCRLQTSVFPSPLHPLGVGM